MRAQPKGSHAIAELRIEPNGGSLTAVCYCGAEWQVEYRERGVRAELRTYTLAKPEGCQKPSAPPACGHSACRQAWIDGDPDVERGACIEGRA